MVGVPGRSKACNTCRQRRVGCSFEKPHCLTCAKANRVCTGYQRERIFIAQGSQYEARKTHPTAKSRVEMRVEVKEFHMVEVKTTASRYRQHQQRHRPSALESPSTRVSDEFLSVSSSPSPRSFYRQRIVDEYLSITYSRKPASQVVDEEPKAGSWLTMIPSLKCSSAALETAILALSTAKLGQIGNDLGMLHQSLNFYVKGLWELQKALWDPKLMYTDETLAACMILIMYEVFECPDGSPAAFMGHMKGCAKLVELRGPEAFTTEFGQHIFDSFRQIEIQQSFAERRSTYLASPRWLDSPFKDRKKLMFHEMIDLMAMVSSLVGNAYGRLTGPLTGTESVEPTQLLLTVLQLIDQCWKMDAKLRSFYTKLEEQTLGPIHWPEFATENPQPAAPTSNPSVFPVAFKFASVDCALVCMFYWATTAILWSGMATIYQIIAGVTAHLPATDSVSGTDASTQNRLHFLTSQLPPLGHRTEVFEVARNICQSMEYFLDDERPKSIVGVTYFPLKVAIESLHNIPGHEKEVLWAEAIVREKLQICGMKLLKNLGVPITDHTFIPA